MRPITLPGIEEYATTNSSPDPQLRAIALLPAR